MPNFGKCFAKLGSYHATPAVGGVAHDADFHVDTMRKVVQYQLNRGALAHIATITPSPLF
jgi:hypothetical protein